MRIADFLVCDQEDYKKMGGRRRRKGFSGGSLGHSPWWVLSRCLSCLKPGSGEPSNSRSKIGLAETGERRTKESERRREERKPIDGSFSLSCPTDGAKGESSSSLVEESTKSSEIVDSSVESSGMYTKELSFNLGLGVAFLFLIAESKNEFKKMMELRTQIELLLKEIKDGMQRKDQYFVESDANNDFSYSSREFNEVGSTNYHLAIQNHQSSNHLVQTEIAKDCIQLSKCDTQRKEGCPEAIEQLEAELETELERLQFSLCTQDSSRNLQHEWGEMAVENDAQERSCFEEVDDHDLDSIKHHGICPLELERRLHELLEVRQKERIGELEFALDCCQNKLLEKEMEISWWKDTARVISQHVPETCLSRYGLQLPKTLHLEKL